MANEPKTLTREALYNRVWSEPISKIASSFNLSDRGLGKLCKRHDIPVPPRGWWAKKQHGHKVTQPALPIGRKRADAPVPIHKQWGPPKPARIDTTMPEVAFEREPAITQDQEWNRDHVPLQRLFAKSVRPQHSPQLDWLLTLVAGNSAFANDEDWASAFYPRGSPREQLSTR
jgi:hypothetical protein